MSVLISSIGPHYMHMYSIVTTLSFLRSAFAASVFDYLGYRQTGSV